MSPRPVLFSTSAMWAIFANSSFFFFRFNNLFIEYAVANADAPLIPKPQLKGNWDLILISRFSLFLFSFFTTVSTVGKIIFLLLKYMIILFFILFFLFFNGFFNIGIFFY